MASDSRIIISHPGGPIRGSIAITGSKSISNRALILNALAEKSSPVHNLSTAEDTQTLVKLLAGEQEEWDAHHAGTTSRFLMAYLSLKCGTQVLTGSARLKQRPMRTLVEALRELGADITYLGEEGYLPIRIGDFLYQKTKTLKVRADVSSQFLSALCLIAPKLQHGLTIVLDGEVVSKPYLTMTLEMMRQFGAKVSFNGDQIAIEPSPYVSKDFHVESDRSSAGYFFSIAALGEDVELEIEKFVFPSLQPDSGTEEWASFFGVSCRKFENGLILKSSKSHRSNLDLDFIKCPDLAQTIAVMGAAKGIKIKYKGLTTLAGKETDRVAALQKELTKVGVRIEALDDQDYEYIQLGKAKIKDPVFDTYQDHRMALSFAPLSLISPIGINNPDVIVKSYPTYWEDLKQLGFEIKPVM